MIDFNEVFRDFEVREVQLQPHVRLAAERGSMIDVLGLPEASKNRPDILQETGEGRRESCLYKGPQIAT